MAAVYNCDFAMILLEEYPLTSIALLIFQFFKPLFKPRKNLILENLMLRQQLNIYKRKNKRPKLDNIDRVILVWISRVFSKWKSALIIVKVSTLIGWHKKAFSYIGKENLVELADLISTGSL
jgi:hypothetical protein